MLSRDAIMIELHPFCLGSAWSSAALNVFASKKSNLENYFSKTL